MSKRIYDSRHGATRKITAAERVSEMACERIAEHQGRSLPVRFWDTPAWARTFHAQVIAANGLLKVFDPEAVLGAFEANPSVRSVGAPFFAREVGRRQAMLEAERGMAAETPPVEVRDPARGPRGGRHAGDTIRARLRRIDAGNKNKDKDKGKDEGEE